MIPSISTYTIATRDEESLVYRTTDVIRSYLGSFNTDKAHLSLALDIAEEFDGFYDIVFIDKGIKGNLIYDILVDAVNHNDRDSGLMILTICTDDIPLYERFRRLS